MAEAAQGQEFRLMAVDDDDVFLGVLGRVLEESGYQVIRARSGPEALARLDAETVDVVLTDLDMPGMDGLLLLEHLRASHPHLPVILMTAFTGDSRIDRALEIGAADFIPKPASGKELEVRIRRVLGTASLLDEIELHRRQEEPGSAAGRRRKSDILVGGSSAIQEVYRRIAMVARNDVTVLIEGESGTGKELVARTIHLSGSRWDAPFVVVNCGAIPENLLEDELFGHEKGAFTGADRARSGVLEEADGGTVFLDEIGELPLGMQVKLLRFLQAPEFRRIGGSRTIRVDIKILAATNRDLAEEVRSGRFREDLFYRVNVVPIRVAALRDRLEDVPLLVDHFIRRHAPTLGRDEVTLSAAAHQRLRRYDWPGNVRQLENLIRNLLITVDRSRIEESDILLPGDAGKDGLDLAVPLPELRRQAVTRLERDYITTALARTGGNISQAARIAGMDRKNFWNLVQRHGIEADRFRK